MTRVGLNLPLFLPGFALLGLEKLRLMPKKFWPKTALEMLSFFVVFYFAIPFAMALYS